MIGGKRSYRKDLQISRTFFPKICDQIHRCGLSARPFRKGAVNFREWTLLWHNSGINATLQQQESIGDEYKLISSLHFLPLNLLR